MNTRLNFLYFINNITSKHSLFPGHGFWLFFCQIERPPSLVNGFYISNNNTGQHCYASLGAQSNTIFFFVLRENVVVTKNLPTIFPKYKSGAQSNTWYDIDTIFGQIDIFFF
jgi:hypothetical protein